MLTPVDCSKVCMYNIIPTANTKKKTTQKDTVKNSIEKIKWNSKKKA